MPLKRRKTRLIATSLRSCVVACCGVVLSLASPAYALPELPHPPPAKRSNISARAPAGNAILLNPIGPTIGLLATAVGLDALFLNMRLHHTVNRWLAATLVMSYGNMRFLFEYQSMGVKFGPRISLPRAGLRGWYVFPMAMLGYGWAQNRSKKVLSSGLLVGAGVESGYLWRWGSFAIEAGGGLYYSAFLHGPADQGASEPGASESGGGSAGAGIKPMINTSLGYAW